MTAKFNLGARLKDRITGIEGVATNYYFHLSGCQYIEIEPDAKDGARSAEIYLPEERYEQAASGSTFADTKVPEIDTCHVKLGDEVKDSLTGFKGHAMMIQIPLFGVGRVAIEPSLDKEGKRQDATFFDEQLVEVIKKKAPPVAKAMPEERKTRGCASSKVPAHILGR